MNKFLGIDVGGTYIKIGTLPYPLPDSAPNVQNFKTIPTCLPSRQAQSNIVEQLYGIIKEVKPKAVGIGIAGLVANGVVNTSPNLPEIKDLKLENLLERRLKIPVKIENDASVAVLGEWKYGAGKGSHNLLLITLGTGIGGGLIINDRLYTGKGFAGEVGHIVIDPDGPPCGCGSYGCLESLVGSNAIVKRAEQGIKLGIKTALTKYSDITPEIISKEAYKGDTFASSVLEKTGYYLGIGIAGLCAVLDPDKVILGGGVAKAGKILFDRIKKEIGKRFYLRKNISIVPAKLGDKAGVIGSIVYVASIIWK